MRKWMKNLIQRVSDAIEKARRFCLENERNTNQELFSIVRELKGYLPAMEKVVNVAERVHIKKEKVPSNLDSALLKGPQMEFSDPLLRVRCNASDPSPGAPGPPFAVS